MLEATDLRYSYHRLGPAVVDGVSLTVDRGEVVGLAGPSGTGKTTLGRLLAGYLVPDRGTVTVDGHPLSATRPTPVQLIFQHPELSIDPRWRLGEALGEAGRVDQQLLHELSIDSGLLNRFPHEVSGGELQRVAVARALMTGAPYVIADEMSAMLDAITQAQLWHAILRRVRRSQLGVLAISHDRPLLAAVADRVLVTETLRKTQRLEPENHLTVPAS